MSVRNVVLIGDRMSGKSELAGALIGEPFKGVYEKTKKACSPANTEPVNGSAILWDTSGHNLRGLRRLVKLKMPTTVLICYSVVNPRSFRNARYIWHPDALRLCHGSQLILVGCQTDLRQDVQVRIALAEGSISETPVSEDEGKAAARNLHCEYHECSAKTGDGLNDLLTTLNNSGGRRLSIRRQRCALI